MSAEFVFVAAHPAGCRCVECAADLALVAAMCRPLQPDNTRAMAVLESYRVVGLVPR